MLRPAIQADLPSIHHIRAQVGLFNYGFLYRWFIERMLLYVIEKESSIIGYVVGFPLQAGLGFCLQIGVLPSMQGQGIGGQLMRAIEAQLNSIYGVKHLFAHTIKANSLYYFTSRLGYQEVFHIGMLTLIHKELV